MAGIPPLIGFFSKQFVLYSAIQGGYYFISIIAILVSVISASYYLKIIRILHEINITNKRKISEKTNINLFKNTYNSISALKVFLLELYANLKINKDSHYLKEIQIIFLYFNILKYELKNNTKEINTSLLKKEIYTNKEL